MKRVLVLLLAFAASLSAAAQIRWIKPFEEGAEVHGAGWEELRHSYVRLPAKAEGKVTNAVWGLSHDSAGLSLVFRSNADEIQVKYSVAGPFSMFHMPSTGTSGIDLYGIDNDGNVLWFGPNFTPKFQGHDILYKYSDIRYPSGRKRYEFHLYLPPYNSVTDLEIGIPEDAEILFYKESLEKPIVAYGTSIAQGACASRPGMMWSNMIERELQYPVVNLGFSGNALSEPEVYSLMSEIDAKIYMIDCLPNMDKEELVPLIRKRVVDGVHILRQTRNCPILLVEHCGATNEATKNSCNFFRKSNAELKLAYEDLLAEGLSDIYYLTTEEIGLCMDGMVEGVHPNDVGMRNYADAYEKKLHEIFSDDFKTFKPVRQNRDDVYIWAMHHEERLSMLREHKPRTVLFGDSITHFWNDNVSGGLKRGEDSWNELWDGTDAMNFGCGWDRIENVLWRISHGELDGYEAENVLLLIGTNNIGYNSNDEIAAGIGEIIREVRERQKTATIYVCGILPRHDVEPERISKLNSAIKKVASDNGARFIDTSRGLAGKDGKILEELFSDGLHPNAEGYRKFAAMLKKGMK